MDIKKVIRKAGFIIINPDGESIPYGEDDINRFSRMVGVWVDQGGVIEEIQETQDDLKRNALFDLISLCDSKQSEAEHLLLAHKATPKQLERYRDKYERAKAGEFSVEENQAIILAHETIRDELRKFADMIELFRQSVEVLIEEGELKKATVIMEAAQLFDATTTQADIEQLLSSV